MASDPATRPSEARPPAPVAGKPTPSIHEAELEPGASGRVLRGATIDFDAAVARRRAGQNHAARRACTVPRLLRQHKPRAGSHSHGRHRPPHLAGPFALPHYQPDPRPPEGHTFYETARRKARTKR